MTGRDALSQLLDECDKCGGSGHDQSRFCPATAWVEDWQNRLRRKPKSNEVACHPCPDCVDGLVIPEAVVKAAAKVLCKQMFFEWEQSATPPLVQLRQAREILADSFRVLMEDA